jgi:hypothetical protein
MRRRWLVPAALLLAVAIAHAQSRSAGPRPPPHKPYDLVSVEIPVAAENATFAAFRNELAEVAKRRIFAELAAVVVTRGFFWDRDFGNGFDPTKSGVENLAAAIGLEADGGAGWNRLAAFAAEPTATPIPLHVGVICGPPDPIYDAAELERLIETTKTQSRVWTYPRDTGVPVHAAPRAGSAVVETLGLHLVHVLAYETAERGAEPERAAWARVATPTGKAGFVAPDMLRPLSREQLCYIKDVIGRWRIAGFVGRGD